GAGGWASAGATLAAPVARDRLCSDRAQESGLRVRSRAPAATARAVARGDPRAALHRDHPGANPGRRVGERGGAAGGGRGTHRAVVGAARRALGLSTGHVIPERVFAWRM